MQFFNPPKHGLLDSWLFCLLRFKVNCDFLFFFAVLKGMMLQIIQLRIITCFNMWKELFILLHWEELGKLYYQTNIKSNLSLYSLYYAEACNKLARPIFTLLRRANTAPFEEMLQRWRAVGNTVSNLTGLRFERVKSRTPKKEQSESTRLSDFLVSGFESFWKT